MRKLAVPLVLAAFVFACAHGTQRETSAYSPAADVELQQAEELVTEFERKQALPTANDPLRNPKNIEDVWEILKRDQADLFPVGVAWAKEHDDLESHLVQAQIELAWSDAQYVLGIVLTELSFRTSLDLRPLEAAEVGDALDEEGKAQLANLRENMRKNEQLIAAVHRLSLEHMWRGAKIARGFMTDVPHSYAGYRLMADFYRLRGQWDLVDQNLLLAEEKNPSSNGVAFLRGIVALERHHDAATAQRLFRGALERDPSFTRARVWLLLTYPSVLDAMDDYAALKAQNPHHQLVVWAGPLIEEGARRAKETKAANAKDAAATDAGTK